MWVRVDSRHHFLLTATEGMKISIDWPDNALPRPGEAMGHREGTLSLSNGSPRVRLERGGSVELPPKGFYFDDGAGGSTR